MGVTGTGLYAGDFAMDLRSTIGAVLRLPFPSDRLVELVCETEPTAARDSEDPDHTVFWLVLADRFHAAGLATPKLLDKAAAIVATDTDLAMMARLGMTEAGLRQRRAVLKTLVARLAARPDKPRRPRILKAPIAYVPEQGGAPTPTPHPAGETSIPISPPWRGCPTGVRMAGAYSSSSNAPARSNSCLGTASLPSPMPERTSRMGQSWRHRRFGSCSHRARSPRRIFAAWAWS
jgi:hypothetical protein